MSAFKTYEECRTDAIKTAREQVSQGLPEAQAERGIEHNALYREWTHKGLPMRQNRYGWELTCEVVKPSDPL